MFTYFKPEHNINRFIPGKSLQLFDLGRIRRRVSAKHDAKAFICGIASQYGRLQTHRTNIKHEQHSQELHVQRFSRDTRIQRAVPRPRDEQVVDGG